MKNQMTTCNTMADYDFIRASQIDGWQEHLRQLLEGRFAVMDGDLVEDPRAPIFTHGFTVAEVEAAIGFAGYTIRELEWFENHPDRYELVDAVWQEIEGWREGANVALLLAALEDKLAEVDAVVAAKQAGTFTWSGHKFYMDRDYISDQIAALPHLPDGYSREWKTADKIGVDNVYVVLDKTGLAAMGMACFAQFNANWSAGDDEKKRLKALYAEGKDVSAIAVDLP